MHVIASFDCRPFELGDERVFTQLTHGIVGASCARAEETYAQGIVLDFGEFIPKRRPLRQSSAVRGEWAVHSWGCDIVLTSPDGYQADSSTDGFPKIRDQLMGMVGVRLSRLVLDPGDLSLLIDLSNKLSIRFVTDVTEPGLDQWFIQLPTGRSVGVASPDCWFLSDE